MKGETTIASTIKKTFTDLVFSLCFWWIFLVSMLDHYLTIKLQESILVDEINPLGIFLIKLDGGSVALFMTLKMAFLWLIYFILLELHKINKLYSIVPLIFLSLFQLMLLVFLLKQGIMQRILPLSENSMPLCSFSESLKTRGFFNIQTQLITQFI